MIVLPRVIGHRGAAARAPENTLAGLRTAHAAGAAWVEVDVRLTGDGHPILCHDATLKRIAGRRRRVGAMTAEALARVDAGSWFSPAFAGETLPTLAATLDLLAELGLGVNLELKASRLRQRQLAEQVARALAEGPGTLAGSVLLSSFDAKAVAWCRDLMPSVPRAMIWRCLPRDWARRCEALGCVSVHLGMRDLFPRDVAAVRDSGRRVGVWTVNDPRRAREIWAWGADAVFSDDPASLLAETPARG